MEIGQKLVVVLKERDNMININATFPKGEAIRTYTFEVNGHKFIFEIQNDEQIGKEPLKILCDELGSIVEITKKAISEEVTKIKLNDILDNGITGNAH